MVKLIKKYKNRRLYDTDKSRYVTIEELQQYVLNQEPFQVIDSSNGKDLTHITLLQILMEMENGAAAQFLSPDLLRQLIIFAHHPMGKSLQKSIEEFFSHMQKSLESNPYLKDYQEVTQLWDNQMKDLLNQWKAFFKQ